MKCISVFLFAILFFSLKSLALTVAQEASLAQLAELYKAVEDQRTLEGMKIGASYSKLRDKRDEQLRTLISQALQENNFTEKDSLLWHMLTHEKLSLLTRSCLLQKIGQKEIEKDQIISLVNFMLYITDSNNRTQGNTPSVINTLICYCSYPDIYDSRSKEIIKKWILKNKVRLLAIDVAGLSSDEEIIKFLCSYPKEMTTDLLDSRHWVATVILAKYGDEIAISKMKETAAHVNVKDGQGMRLIPYGLSYTGRKDMIEILFDMLKSDIKKWNGADVMPQECKLSHEAACALSLAVKDFPKYDPYQQFTDKDQKTCIDWVNAHKENYEIINNNVGLYLKYSTLFGQ